MSDAADRLGYPVVDLPASTACSGDAAVQFLIAELVRSGRLAPDSAERVFDQLLRREAIASTGVGGGIALPHCRSDAVGEVVGIVGRSAVPVAWSRAADGKPVRLVCLLVTPASEPGASLRALEAISRRLRGG